MYQGWCGSRAEDGCCSALGTVGWSRPIATLGGRNRCPGPEIVAITCAAFPKHTHSHLSWPVGPEGLDRQADCPLISTRTRGEMPRRPDVLACARERKAAGRGGSVERTQGAGARSASATPPWAEGVGFGSSARCGSSCPPVVPSRQTTRSAHRAQDISRAAPQANRVTAGAEAPRGVWAHTAPRPPIGAELWGASFGEHRLRAALLQPALCQAERNHGVWLPKLLKPRPQQSSVRPARTPLAARAAVTITTTSAKGAGDSRSRTSRSPPTCARGTAPSPTI